EGRARKRKHDLAIRLEVARTVELRRLLEVARDRQEVLAHQAEARRSDELYQDHAGAVDEARVVPAEMPDPEMREPARNPIDEHFVNRDEPQLVGNHQRPENEHEEHLATGELEARERIAAEGGKEEVRDRDRAGDDRAVQRVAPEVEGVEGLVVAGGRPVP